MFSRLASALYSAVDALAPPLPLQEEFIWHWEATANYYTDKRSCGKTPVESTGIPNHLEQMLKILEQERSEYQTDTPGLCLEYVLQNKLLDTMCVLARADTPPGMKRYVLNFVRRLLEITRFTLLPHIHVYSCVQKLIKLCGESLASPSERDEIFFLQLICEKLHQRPELVSCFLTDCKTNDFRRLSLSSQSSSESNDTKPSLQFPLVKSLLTLLKSPDSDVSDCAAECLTVCCMFPNDSSSEIIIHHTTLCSSVVNQLVVLYKGIPHFMKPTDIDDALAKWSSDITIVSEAHISPSARKLLCFFRWLDFINKLMSQAHENIMTAMGVTFQNDFLENYLYSDLLSEDNSRAIFCTSLISACICQLGSSPLTTYLCKFLVGEITEPEIPGFSNHSLKDLLIDRCRNTSQYPLLSLATLQLFEELLRRPTENVLNSLILCNLVPRSYYDHSAADDYFSLSEDEEDGEEFASKYLNQEYEGGPAPPKASLNNTFAPKHINKILNCFLLLLPEEIKSCGSEEDSGYEVYVKDAQRQFHDCLIACENCDWPIEPLKAEVLTSGEEDESSDSQPEADHLHKQYFYEGAFLSMIFDKIENILYQPYEVNLQITSMLSKLALIPHPNLHEYLLNPFIPLSPGTRSLFVVLLRVVEDIQVAVQNVPHFKKDLKLMRRALLSDECEEAQVSRFESASTLEALIVVEEFCKELAAIAFIKSHAAS